MFQLFLYPPSAYNSPYNTPSEYSPDIDDIVQQIQSACKGFRTDEKRLIQALGAQTVETRNRIITRYYELYRKPLAEKMKKKCPGDFGMLMQMISSSLPETEALFLRQATKGLGTNESLCIQVHNQISFGNINKLSNLQILAGRSNEEMQLLRRTFFNQTGKDLSVIMNSETSGDFRKVIMAMLQAARQPYHPSIHTADRAKTDAIALYNAGQGRLGTDETTFIKILVECPPTYLSELDAVYFRMYHNNIVKAIEKEFSFDAKKSLILMVRLILDPYPPIAEIFESTMKGFGTSEKELSLALVRYQCVLHHVKSAYQRLYAKDLRNRIHGETSGYYRQLLLAIYDAPLDPQMQQNLERNQPVVPPWQNPINVPHHHVYGYSPSMPQMHPTQSAYPYQAQYCQSPAYTQQYSQPIQQYPQQHYMASPDGYTYSQNPSATNSYFPPQFQPYY
ncbi:unnamed protein product [Albugo candida]|uniref:Annexin n=2 Tax=Albugo candida TaxID=65357 RepID=A0A024G997_9STRA|nr:unnamed protein product [Albugo candida]|eukprot:CCI43254.1 unnamed protein product [Albugo candida]